ncbi:hypothetical protein XENOCAPTIV_011830 [Xenoophorus captivus]|uniref:Uncharacterized protein n=1 Tax=Xenoophorus captivus TaxID=1517983 RepID=A0ABV0S6Q9_9TELE
MVGLPSRLPVVTVLTGGSTDTAASALTLEDCPDIDHRETIGSGQHYESIIYLGNRISNRFKVLPHLIWCQVLLSPDWVVVPYFTEDI